MFEVGKIRGIANTVKFSVTKIFVPLPKPQADFFESTIVDITSGGKFPANVLSNLYPSNFKFEGVKFNSMEGFLQALKTPDKQLQKEIHKMSGMKARRMSNVLRGEFSEKTAEWKGRVTEIFDGKTMHWKENTIDRFSPEYNNLIKRAFDAKFEQDPLFRYTLEQTKGKTLAHTIGKSSKEETILTEQEFINLLEDLRSRLQRKQAMFIGAINYSNKRYSPSMKSNQVSNDIMPKLGDNCAPDAPQYIQDIIKKLKKATTKKEGYGILNDAVAKIPQFECHNYVFFVGDSYQFQCTLKRYTDIPDFQELKRKHPDTEFLGVIDIGNSGSSVIVSRRQKLQDVQQILSSSPNTPEYIKDIIQQLEKAKNKNEIYEILNKTAEKVPPFRNNGGIYYTGDNWQFQCTSKTNADAVDIEQFKENYPWYDIEGVKVLNAGDSQTSVVISKWLGDDRMIPLAKPDYGHFIDKKYYYALAKGKEMSGFPEHVKDFINKCEKAEGAVEAEKLIYEALIKNPATDHDGIAFAWGDFEIVNAPKQFAGIPADLSEIHEKGSVELDALRIIDIPASKRCIIVKKWKK